MRRSHSLVVTLAFLVAVAGFWVAKGRHVQAQTTSLTATRTLSSTALASYKKLVDADAGEAALRTWARANQLEVVSIDRYRIAFIPEYRPQTVPDAEAAGACNHRLCPQASGVVNVKNTAGQNVGLQNFTCTAGSCKWIYNKDLKSWTRICSDYRCTNVGAVQKW